MPCAGRLPCGRQGDVDTFGDQHSGVALGPQRRQSFVVAALDLAAGDVDALADVGPVILGHAGQRLSRKRQRRAVAEVLGLGARQLVEIVGKHDRLAGGVDGLGQCFRRQHRQIDGLITHAATLSLLARLVGLPTSALSWAGLARLLLGPLHRPDASADHK